MIAWKDGELVITDKDRDQIEALADRFLDFITAECKGKIGPVGGMIAMAWGISGTLHVLEEVSDNTLTELFQAELARCILTNKIEPNVEWETTHEGSEQIN